MSAPGKTVSSRMLTHMRNVVLAGVGTGGWALSTHRNQLGFAVLVVTAAAAAVWIALPRASKDEEPAHH